MAPRSSCPGEESTPLRGDSGHPVQRKLTLYRKCPRRLKIPQTAGREFLSPREVVVDCVGQWVQHRFWPVKRRRALLESNPPRNSRPETHRGRWEGRGVKAAPFILARGRPTGGGIRLPARRVLPHIGPIDLGMPQKTHNAGPRFPDCSGRQRRSLGGRGRSGRPSPACQPAGAPTAINRWHRGPSWRCHFGPFAHCHQQSLAGTCTRLRSQSSNDGN